MSMAQGLKLEHENGWKSCYMTNTLMWEPSGACRGGLGFTVKGGVLLGGPWGLVTTYNWAYNPTYNPPKWAYRGYPNYK